MHHLTVKQLPSPPLGKTYWPWSANRNEISSNFEHRKVWPKITVVTPSYQQGCFIEETIRSVLMQGYPNLEYVIIDGGSTDETVEIIRKYEPYINYWVSEPDRGQGHAVNKGWSLANGEILGWLNSDDLYLPNALKTVAEAFLENKQLDLVTGAVSGRTIDLIEHRNKPPRDFDLNYYIWFNNLGPGQPGIFLTKALYQQIGPINEELHYTLDREYWMRIAQTQSDLNYKKLFEPLAIAREYDGNKSSSANLKIYFERVKLLDTVYSSSNIPLSVKKLKGSAYSAVFHSLANKLFEDKQMRNAMEYYLKAIQSKPSLLIKRPEVIKSLFQTVLS